MEAALIKHSLITIGKGIVTLLALAFIFTRFGGCDNKIEVAKTDNSQYFAKMKSDSMIIINLMQERYEDSLKTLASKRAEDSIKVVADKNEKLYRSSSKRVRELLARGICDTVLIQVAFNDCDSTIKSKDSLLAQKDSTNKSINEELGTVKEELRISKSMVATAQTIIKNQTEDYKILEKESKKALRKQKIKTIGAIIVASITEVLTIFALR
jgi:predicted RND superfamily exporter protein